MKARSALAVTGVRIAGAVLWLGLFLFLQNRCVLDAFHWIESAGVTRVDDYFVKNLNGEIALRIVNGDCGGRYLYSARYQAVEGSSQWEARKLSTLVDLKSWRAGDQDGTTVHFEDSRHRYRLFLTSDGPYLVATDKQ